MIEINFTFKILIYPFLYLKNYYKKFDKIINMRILLKLQVKILLIFIFISLILNENVLAKKMKLFLNFTKISIIMPIYNSEKFLSLSLNNILSQSLKNIEIICIDDGSSDGSLKILKNYKKVDNRLSNYY